MFKSGGKLSKINVWTVLSSGRSSVASAEVIAHAACLSPATLHVEAPTNIDPANVEAVRLVHTSSSGSNSEH